MVEELSLEVILKNIDKKSTYFTEEINENELISKNHKTVSRNLNCIEKLLILFSAVTQYVFISTFASLAGISIGIIISAVGFNDGNKRRN